MGRGVLLVLFQLLICHAFSQVREELNFAPLKPYNFEERGYALVFIPHRGEGVLYAEGKEQLNAFKNLWVFDKKAVTYPFACNDGYRVALVKDKDIVNNYYIRMRCRAFVVDSEYWHLNLASSVISAAGLRRAVVEQSSYKTLEEGRRKLALAQIDPEVIFVERPPWENYEGYFFVRRRNPNFSGRAPFKDWDELLEETKAKIKKQYPKHDFEISLASYGSGKNYPNISFRVYGDKKFFDSFKLYDITDWGWRPFDRIDFKVYKR